MSEENAPKRQRSVINPVKMVNLLREEKGLPRIATRAKTVRITPELKKEITAQELARLFPEALTQANYEFNEEQAKRLVKEVEFRLAKIRAGKEAAPDVEGAAPAKRRGRPPRNA